MAVLELRPEGLYCPAGDFHIDPWRPVERAVFTHAHADHARRGHARALAQRAALGVLRQRLGELPIQAVDYGESVTVGGARVSLHPAGHVLGSAQVRVEVGGEVWVVTGDYKLDPDPTCAAFEPVRAHTLITESTFGLPVYRWAPARVLFDGIDAWWRANAQAGRASVLYAYAFGKAQRLLAGVDASIGPIVCHGAVEALNRCYREAGVALPETSLVTAVADRATLARALVVAPPSAQGSSWLRRFGDCSDAFASGWMQLRGARRRRGTDRGFVVSDHADWPGLLCAVRESGAQRVYVTHGQAAAFARHLCELGLDARLFDSRDFDAHYAGEGEGQEDAPADTTQDAAQGVASASTVHSRRGARPRVAGDAQRDDASGPSDPDVRDGEGRLAEDAKPGEAPGSPDPDARESEARIADVAQGDDASGLSDPDVRDGEGRLAEDAKPGEASGSSDPGAREDPGRVVGSPARDAAPASSDPPLRERPPRLAGEAAGPAEGGADA